MAKLAKDIVALTDDDLILYTLSSEEGSLGLGQAALQMRIALRTEKINREVATSTQNLMDATRDLAQETRKQVGATQGVMWGTIALALATLALAIITFLRR
ncbi:MAG TPA: hypothetical protein VFI75_00370 [Candidatus Acidoferrum sp.]|nr:hypothetical protein [Candidatus Acidoferrum sp.]